MAWASAVLLVFINSLITSVCVLVKAIPDLFKFDKFLSGSCNAFANCINDVVTSTWFTWAISAAAWATREYESTPMFLKLVNKLKPLVNSSWLNKVWLPNLFAASCNSFKAIVPAPKFSKPYLKIAISLSLAVKVPIALLTVATAAPTVIKGPSEAANEAPNPFAAVDVAA